MDKKHEYTSKITCPYCGWEDNDSWEFDGDDGEEIETTCGRCEKLFLTIRNISVTYSTVACKELGCLLVRVKPRIN